MSRQNLNSGYGMATATKFRPQSPTGRTFVVGNSTLDNLQLVQDLFRPDNDGVIRVFTTLATAIAAVFQYKYVSVTASASADTFTTASPHGLNNGEKVVLAGTTAPTNTTLGVVYYVVGATSTTFQVSASRGGTAIDLGSAGTAVIACPFSNTGDTIYVLPGHNENVSSSTALNFNVAGVSIVGLGYRETRPTLYMDTATTAIVTVSAPQVSIENIIIDGTGFDAIATMVSVTGSDATFRNCKFNFANATNQATVVITTTALADRMTIEDCAFYGTANAGTATAIKIVGGDGHIIRRNVIMGNFTTSLGGIQNVTTACTNIVVEDNFIDNRTASAAVCMTFVSTSTGVARKNHMQILTGTAPIVGAALSWVGANYYAATIATAGTLI